MPAGAARPGRRLGHRPPGRVLRAQGGQHPARARPAGPVIIGGKGEATVRRTVSYGDGWLAIFCSARRFAQTREQIIAAAGAAGRAVPGWYGINIWCGLDTDETRARQLLASQLEGLYRIPFGKFEHLAPAGTPDRVASQLAPYLAAGVTHMSLIPAAASAGAGVERAAAVRAADRIGGCMQAREQADSVEWMRQRWLEHRAPRPEHFAAMASLLRTTVVLTEELDRVLKQNQLSRTGYLILITLQMSQDETRPLGQLSKALLVHPTTITMAIDQLEKAGLVRRVPHPSDRRTVLAELTAQGRQAAGHASAALAEVNFGLRDTSEATAVRVTGDLRKIREALGDLG